MTGASGRDKLVDNPTVNEAHFMDGLAYHVKISNHLAGKLDIRSALRSVKAEIEKVLPLDHLDICLIDEDSVWNTSYEVGLRTDWSSSRRPISVSPVRDVLTSKVDCMITDNAMKDERYVFEGALSGPIFQYGLKSRVNVAMKVFGKTIGSLNCSSTQESVYSEAHIEHVRNLSHVVTPYFYALRATESARREALIRSDVQVSEEGLRVGALNLTEALERERRRIGMDLHDQTLADLTRIARDLSGDVSRKDIHQLQQRVQDCIQGLREIIDTSIPSILELFGFKHAVNSHMNRALSSAKNIDWLVTDKTDNAVDKLSETIRTSLYRITQEAINNSVQHANASYIEVIVDKDLSHGLCIKIIDNGRADTAQLMKKARGGIMHMKTRARLIGAAFNMSNEQGTCVSIKLPVLNANAEEPGR